MHAAAQSRSLPCRRPCGASVAPRISRGFFPVSTPSARSAPPVAKLSAALRGVGGCSNGAPLFKCAAGADGRRASSNFGCLADKPISRYQVLFDAAMLYSCRVLSHAPALGLPARHTARKKSENGAFAVVEGGRTRPRAVSACARGALFTPRSADASAVLLPRVCRASASVTQFCRSSSSFIPHSPFCRDSAAILPPFFYFAALQYVAATTDAGCRV